MAPSICACVDYFFEPPTLASGQRSSLALDAGGADHLGQLLACLQRLEALGVFTAFTGIRLAADTVHVVGLLIGLSVVVINVTFTVITTLAKKNLIEEVS